MLTEGPMNSICGTPDEIAAWKKGYNAGIVYRHEDDKRRERIVTAALQGLLANPEFAKRWREIPIMAMEVANIFMATMGYEP